MEESGTKLHIPLVLKHFVLFPQKLSECGRVYISLNIIVPLIFNESLDNSVSFPLIFEFIDKLHILY